MLQKKRAYLKSLPCFLCFLQSLIVYGFIPQLNGRVSHKRVVILLSTPDDEKERKSRYKFGDITRSLAKKASNRVKKLTGKEKYSFGDLSRYLDERAKSKVSSIIGKEDYKFGDLTKWADSVAKKKVANFTGKESFDAYEFGDISKTVVKKVRSGEYSVSDVLLSLRVLLSAGISLAPIASVLPIKWLIQLLNFGIAQDVGKRILGTLASTIDSRMKEALTGNASYQLGDLTKEKIRESIKAFTGKDTYDFGDISRRILSQAADSQKAEHNNFEPELSFNDAVADELAEWDKRFQEETGTDDHPVVSKEVMEWEGKFLRETGEFPSIRKD